jgi:hypothetical protein
MGRGIFATQAQAGFRKLTSTHRQEFVFIVKKIAPKIKGFVKTNENRSYTKMYNIAGTNSIDFLAK